jgi:hypothetical protein
MYILVFDIVPCFYNFDFFQNIQGWVDGWILLGRATEAWSWLLNSIWVCDFKNYITNPCFFRPITTEQESQSWREDNVTRSSGKNKSFTLLWYDTDHIENEKIIRRETRTGRHQGDLISPLLFVQHMENKLKLENILKLLTWFSCLKNCPNSGSSVLDAELWDLLLRLVS